MNSFEKQGLDDDAFGEKSGIASFDAFRKFIAVTFALCAWSESKGKLTGDIAKTKASYQSTTSRGGQWTVVLGIFCFFLTVGELHIWWNGNETHHFSVERGIGHELQLNLDVIVRMPCDDLHVNVQDAAMDRIVAGQLLTKDETNWNLWTQRPSSGDKGYKKLHQEDLRRRRAEEEDIHVGHVLGHMREGGRKFMKTPKLKRSELVDSCRIYGSLEGNKVQGDFHITARGHGYSDPGLQQHLGHETFNFSHYINELSFGPHYPNLLNPLDRTAESTDAHFYKFQYFLSIVPTIFTKRRVSTPTGALDPAAIPQPPTLDLAPDVKHPAKDGNIQHKMVYRPDSKSVFTNQYAATSQSRNIPENMVPGIFFKYDIEPILLIVSEQRGSLLALIVRLVNVISGVLVGGGWLFQLSEWATEAIGRRRRQRGASYGVLDGRPHSQ